jgi:hypothetical protein
MDGSSSIQVSRNMAGSNQAFKVKSLIQNILPVSACESIFYVRLAQPSTRKSLKTNNFGSAVLPANSQRRANSLFQKILPVSSCGSRFCEDRSLTIASNSLRMSILGFHAKKM